MTRGTKVVYATLSVRLVCACDRPNMFMDDVDDVLCQKCGRPAVEPDRSPCEIVPVGYHR